MRYKYKLESHDGIASIIIYKKKILLLKRRNIPIILNRGIWSFLFGGRDRGEKHITTAYREIKEEVKIAKSHLRMLYTTKVYLKEEGKRIMWLNQLFIFRSDTDKVKLDIENSSYRWAQFRDIEKEINYTNILINEKPILNKIKGFLDERS